jgi:antitoxin (DNA-binding transcriptional repressor) of toxin-antitoxin stability system
MYHANVSHMKTTTIRELRHDTTTVLAWVAGGESVEVRRRGEPVAVLSPRKRKGRIVRPDFEGRLRASYGDQVLTIPATDVISESRGET